MVDNMSIRKERERKARKKLIIDSALATFKESGIDGVTMEQIAISSDFGKATLYYYFTSKDDIISSILEEGWENLLIGIEDIISSDSSPEKKFLDVINKLALIVSTNHNVYEFLFTAHNAVQNTEDQAWKKYQSRLYNTILGIIDDGMRKKKFVDLKPEVIMQAIGGIFHSLVFMDKEIKENDFSKLIERFMA